jgi:hypothetical protein
MKKMNKTITLLALAGLFAGCGDSDKQAPPPEGEDQAATEQPQDHAHDEMPLGKFDVGGLMVEAAQGHGSVEAGKEGHLVIKLPHKDDGATVIRAWIGLEDRTLSSVGKGEYAPSHDDYDIHTVAPDPLPAGTKWWLALEMPDGTKAVGSFPLLKDIPKAN